MEWTALAAGGVAAALCAVVVRQRAPELAALVGLAACAVLLGKTLPAVGTVRERLEDLSRTAGVSPALLEPVMKTVGLSIVTRLSSSLCRDAGEGSIAAFVELAGSAAAVVVSLPLLDQVLRLVTELL